MSKNIELFRLLIERGFNQGDLSVADEICAQVLAEHEYLAPDRHTRAGGAVFRPQPRMTYVLSHSNAAETKQAADRVVPFRGGASEDVRRRWSANMASCHRQPSGILLVAAEAWHKFPPARGRGVTGERF